METEIIKFFKDKQGKIVGRVACGKIAIIDFNYKGTHVNENETWDCEIVIDESNKVIVKPIEKIINQ